MKKMLFGLIATFMFTGANAQNTEIKASEYGFYHNEGVALFQKGTVKVANGSEKALNAFAQNLSKKYPGNFTDINIVEFNKKFYGLTVSNFSIKLLWEKNKLEFIEKQKPSAGLVTLVNELVEMDMTPTDMLSKVREFRNSAKISVNDDKALVVFESVLKSSNDYWNNYNSTLGKSKPGSKAIVADCLGALMFCYSGAGSIIMGGICSLFVNEALEK